ncbi:MAG: AIR carboxylase family protein [Bacteroidia bacterium]|nr:AIR carboxylase family protein [Bacteroidia bacterium]MDW8133489.1 AIR carboxylase family protein [Bacteroidia bacterium]
MSRTEIVLLYETLKERSALQEVQSILSQMGISFREESLPHSPTLPALRQVVEGIGQSVCIWAAGRSAYLLPVLSASLTFQQPLVVIPCPDEKVSLEYLQNLFEAVQGYPIVFTLPKDTQAAALLAVHLLAARHPSYADLLYAFLNKRLPQPA